MRRDPAPDGYELEFEDTFDGRVLDPARWIAHYLPHWSTPDRTAARYDLADGRLRLRIDADQAPWCPPLDGDLRVSSIQTGVFAGPVGTGIGQHRFKPGVVVTTGQRAQRLYTPQYGQIEIRMRASTDLRAMVACWMIGFEDAPERSAELCIAEIFGRDVGVGRTRVGMGLRPFGDPRIVDDFESVELPIDASLFHTYSADWTPEHVTWFVDGQVARVFAQSPQYPMQLLISLYEFPREGGVGDPSVAAQPPVFEVDWVRGFRPRLL